MLQINAELYFKSINDKHFLYNILFVYLIPHMFFIMNKKNI